MSDILGHFYIVAAPSGAGKTSLVNALVAAQKHLKISISYTTRPQRPGETNDVDYHFVSKEKFAQMVNDKQFLEHATVFGNEYGTSRDWVLKQLEKGNDVILEIDWQGARQIRQLFPTSTTIFIVPPSLAVLEERLKARNQDDTEIIVSRMRQSVEEMSHFYEFDYLVINEVFEEALADLVHIVEAKRLKTSFQEKLRADLLADLLKKQ